MITVSPRWLRSPQASAMAQELHFFLSALPDHDVLLAGICKSRVSRLLTQRGDSLAHDIVRQTSSALSMRCFPELAPKGLRCECKVVSMRKPKCQMPATELGFWQTDAVASGNLSIHSPESTTPQVFHRGPRNRERDSNF